MWANLIERIAGLLTLPLASWTYVDILLLAAITVALFFLLKYVLKILGAFFKILWKGIRNLSAKKRCSRVQCPHCGRMLDKCVCESNKNKSYAYRLRKYRKEKRQMEKNK